MTAEMTVQKKLERVQQLHKELQTLKNESETQGDSPRLKAVIGLLIRMTEPFNPNAVPAPDCMHPQIVDGVCTSCGGQIPSLQTGAVAVAVAPGKCPPHTNISPFGVCRDCNTCLHEFVNTSGICNQCGVTVAEKAEAPGAAA